TDQGYRPWPLIALIGSSAQRRAGVDRGCVKTLRELPRSRAEGEFLRFFSLCEAIGLEIRIAPANLLSFHTISTRSGSPGLMPCTVAMSHERIEPRIGWPARSSAERRND